MSATQETPRKDFYVHIGAPDPIIIRYRAGGSGGTLQPFDSTLKFTFASGSTTTTLGVGTGITLSTDESVSNARATIQFSVAQSRSIPDGATTPYEIQRTISGREEVILVGMLIGEGGVNTDG